MESHSLIIGGLTVGVFAALTIWSARSQSQFEKSRAVRQKEEKTTSERKEALAVAEDLAAICDAQALLPDYVAVVRKLRTRFSWEYIVQACGLDASQFEILHLLPESGTKFLTLPNFSGRSHTDLEREFVERVEREQEWNRHFVEDALTFGIDSMTARPTVEALQSLAMQGFVSVEDPDYAGGRSFSVSIAVPGRNALLLERADPGLYVSGFALLGIPTNARVRQSLSELMQTLLFELGDLFWGR